MKYEEMKTEELRKLRDKLSDQMLDQMNDKWLEWYEEYSKITNILDERWREENYEDFRKYELKMGDPDFDWGFYSDWHKDMYGPHREIIPANDEERKEIFRDWHAQRGF